MTKNTKRRDALGRWLAGSPWACPKGQNALCGWLAGSQLSSQNPFSSGLATRTPIHELVRYSFEAVEAWSRERGWPREESQTPLEFVRHIARVDPSVRAAVVKLGDLYSCAAYADGTLASSNLDYLQDLWKQLETAPPHVPHPT